MCLGLIENKGSVLYLPTLATDMFGGWGGQDYTLLTKLPSGTLFSSYFGQPISVGLQVTAKCCSVAALCTCGPQVQTAMVNCLNLVLSLPDLSTRARSALFEERPLLPHVIALLDHSLPLLRAKAVVSVLLMCRCVVVVVAAVSVLLICRFVIIVLVCPCLVAALLLMRRCIVAVWRLSHVHVCGGGGPGVRMSQCCTCGGEVLFVVWGLSFPPHPLVHLNCCLRLRVI